MPNSSDDECLQLKRSIRIVKARIAALRRTHPEDIPPELQDLFDKLAAGEDALQTICGPLPQLSFVVHGRLDFGFVMPGTTGPNLFVDPSIPPPAISFAGGITIQSAPADAIVSASITGDTAHFQVRDIIVVGFDVVDLTRLVVAQADGGNPVSVRQRQLVLVRVQYAALDSEGTFKGTCVIQSTAWETKQFPLSLTLGGVTASFPETLTIIQGEQASLPVTMRSVAGPQAEVVFELSPLQLDTGLSLAPNRFLLNPGEVLSRNLTFQADTDAPLGPNTVFVERLAFNQRLGMLLPVNILARAAPPPDPRVDHFDVGHVPGSTQRICQLTGGGDPEGKPHPNDTTRFALLGTDLGTSFDHVQDGQQRTYFFFGDTHTGAGADDGDAIAFTTDDDPEPEGLHLQFIMGDNQWRRLVIPGVSLENFEVPTGGFSHAGRLFVFAMTDVLDLGNDRKFPQRSVLASAVDAHDNFDLHFSVSSRDDKVDTPQTGGRFINAAAWRVANDDLPGLPDNAMPGGEGVLMVGTGKYRESAPYLAYMPLPAGGIPQLTDLRYLKRFLLFVPSFGPSGPPDWSDSEADAMPLFDDKIGELSFLFNADLGRWLLVYPGCPEGKCGVLLRSAPRPWGPWSPAPQLIFESVRDKAQGKYMFECGPYGSYVISRYSRFDRASKIATIYYTVSNGECRPKQLADFAEPHYQVHLMKSSLRLVGK